MTKEQLQLTAYQNREKVKPGDWLTLTCTRAEHDYSFFRMQHSTLVIQNTEKHRPKLGEKIYLICKEMQTGKNGYGNFVDYIFNVQRLGTRVRINGPDVHSMASI